MPSPGRGLRFLYSLQSSGIKRGLSNIKLLLAEFGHPERAFPSIHVAGTNGKGSVSAMIASCLTSGGHRTGLYTSPHLVDFRERMRIDGVMIPRERLEAYAARLEPVVRATGATFFEATTAIAFRWFADERVDVGVIETGLGGRWDATNVITPMVSVITTIGLEHREYLGNTIRKIAFEKAGIIKKRVPCVVGAIDGAALEVIGKRARLRRAPLIEARRETEFTNVRHDSEGLTGDLLAERRILRGLRVSAAGKFQEMNARTALAAIEALGTVDRGFALSDATIRRGFGSIARATGFSGRLQQIGSNPSIILDVAHNPDAVAALANSLRANAPGKHIIVLGVVKDKEYRTMIDHLRPFARIFHFVQASSERSRDPRDLLAHAHERAIPARFHRSVGEGLRAAIASNAAGETILVTGSHFVVGEAISHLGMRR